MYLAKHIKQGIENLCSSKLRSFLAILGILIGTGSVVALVSSGELATRVALAQFKSLGTNLLSVTMFEQLKQQDSHSNNSQKHRALSLQAANNIKNIDNNILIAAPYTITFGQTSFKGNLLNTVIIGATQQLAPTIKISMQAGRFVSNLDHYSNYCVIGQGVYQNIKKLGITDVINKQIRINNAIYTIIGIAKHWPENSFFQQDINNAIILPIQATLVLNKYTQITNVVVRLKQGAAIKPIKNAIQHYINNHAPGHQLFVRSAQQLIAKMQSQQQTFTLLLGVIGGISLLVGGIGVMNIMLVSVVERKREIGIRRAVGAKKRDIQILFVVESTILSLFGGILGVIFGVLASFIIAEFSHWPFMLFIIPPVLGFVVSASIGIFFGFYPAYRASQLDPIQALRSE